MTQDIKVLLSQLAAYPDDDKLLAKIALYYIEHPDGNQDLAYLEKAYQANPSIENTHNLAFWLHHEYGEYERALLLQKQVMAQQPQSYFPYVNYAQMLLTQNKNEKGGLKLKDINPKDADRYQEIISTYQLALSKIYNIAINQGQYHFKHAVYCLNNIGYAYVMLDNYEQAVNYFDQALAAICERLSEDNKAVPTGRLEEQQFDILLNKVRLYIVLKDKNKALELLNEARQNEQHCSLEIAQLYAMLGEYTLADKVIGEERPHESWDWIWFAISQVNHKKWRLMLAEALESEQALLQEAKLEAEQLRLDDKQSELCEQLDYIKASEATIARLNTRLIAVSQLKPQLNIKQAIRDMYMGCLLFGCEYHHNLIADNDQCYLN